MARIIPPSIDTALLIASILQCLITTRCRPRLAAQIELVSFQEPR